MNRKELKEAGWREKLNLHVKAEWERKAGRWMVATRKGNGYLDVPRLVEVDELLIGGEDDFYLPVNPYDAWRYEPEAWREPLDNLVESLVENIDDRLSMLIKNSDERDAFARDIVLHVAIAVRDYFTKD